MDRLPPLNGLRAFDAAARHLSVTLAAEELHVTPGAVSKQIHQLEDALKVHLFIRGHRQITLTSQGEDYYRAISSALELVRDATLRLASRARRRQLRIRAYTTFAMRWLIPRLSGFHSAHPDIEVLLTTSLDAVDFARDDLDGAVRLGTGDWPGTKSHRLVPNILAPVASPSLLQSGLALSQPSDIRHHTLLHSVARPDDWEHWLTAAGVTRHVDPRAGMTYQSSAMAYAAAIEGHGLAMAQLFLVEKDIAEDRLIQPFKMTIDMGNYTYYLVTPSHRPETPSMATFRSWMLQQLVPAQSTSGGSQDHRPVSSLQV